MSKETKVALTKNEKKKILDKVPTQSLDDFLNSLSEEERIKWLEENWY